MQPSCRNKLRALLLHHEGYRQFPYVDTTGNLTIGIGRNISTNGISEVEAFYLLDDDIQYFNAKLIADLPYFNDLDENRQVALIDMCFNLGVKSFLSFVKMHDAMKNKNYKEAAAQMLDSKWATQVGKRAEDIADIIQTGSLGNGQ